MPSCATTFRALTYVDDVKVVIVTGAGGNFCSGGDVHEIIGPLTKMDMPGLLRLHPHDRRSGQGDARLPAADRRRDRRRLRRRRRHHRHGRPTCASARPAAKTAFLFTRVGLAGCDMGACAMLPRIIGQGRAAELLYTGRVDERPRRASAGASTTGWSRRRAAPRRAAQARQALAAGPTFAHGITKTHAQHRNGHEPRRRRSSGSPGPGDLHGRPTISAAPIDAFVAKREAGVRGRLMADRTFLDWPFFDDAHRALAADSRAWCEAELRRMAMTSDDIDALAGVSSRSSATAAGCAIACRRPRAGCTRRSTSARCASIRETLARHAGSPISPSPCRGWARGTITLFGSRGAEAPYLPKVARGRADRRLRAVRARRPAPTSRDVEPARGATASITCSTAPRPGSPTAASPITTWSSPAPARRPAPRAFPPSSSTRTPRASTITERIDVIAPHPLGDARIRRHAACPPRRCSANAGEGFKIAMATLDIFRTTVGAAALGFARRALDEATARAPRRQSLGGHAGRLPAHPGEARRHGARRRCRGAARLSRGLAKDVQQGARNSREAAHGQAPRHRRRSR